MIFPWFFRLNRLKDAMQQATQARLQRGTDNPVESCKTGDQE